MSGKLARRKLPRPDSSPDGALLHQTCPLPGRLELPLPRPQTASRRPGLQTTG